MTGPVEQAVDNPVGDAPGPSGQQSPTDGPRLARARADDPVAAAVVDRVLQVALDGLPQMHSGRDGLFCFTRRGRIATGGPAGGGFEAPVEGVSHRYTGMVALGARHLPEPVQRALLAGRSAAQAADRLVELVDHDRRTGLGDVAVAAWAVAQTGGATLPRALELLAAAEAADTDRFVVDVAWTTLAYVAARSAVDVERPLSAARGRLLGALTGSPLFPHRFGPAAGWRSHVGCFADQVYPVQALSRLHASDDDPTALSAAQACADRICALQGAAGQWWWHYDARTGGVVEGYPVYSVHQHAMGPMALLDLRDAGGTVDDAAIARSLRWLVERPEPYQGPLVLDDAALTWRKVARADVRKLARGAQALATGITGRRAGLLDTLWSPRSVDRECRPYELGWCLDTWAVGAVPSARTGPGEQAR